MFLRNKRKKAHTKLLGLKLGVSGCLNVVLIYRICCLFVVVFVLKFCFYFFSMKFTMKNTITTFICVCLSHLFSLKAITFAVFVARQDNTKLKKKKNDYKTKENKIAKK